MTKTNILLNKSIYIGPAVLDLSKVLMAEFHYDFIRAKYGNRAELLFTDTDSLCYHIHTDDVYADFRASLNIILLLKLGLLVTFKNLSSEFTSST